MQNAKCKNQTMLRSGGRSVCILTFAFCISLFIASLTTVFTAPQTASNPPTPGAADAQLAGHLRRLLAKTRPSVPAWSRFASASRARGRGSSWPMPTSSIGLARISTLCQARGLKARLVAFYHSASSGWCATASWLPIVQGRACWYQGPNGRSEKAPRVSVRFRAAD